MARLTEEQKTFIVSQFACFERPLEISRQFKARFGLELPLPQIDNYNFDHTHADARSFDKWQPLWDSVRANYLAGTAGIAISHAAFRLRKLDEMFEIAYRNRNYKTAAALLEQAAKETGGGYGSRRGAEAKDDDANGKDAMSDEADIPGNIKREMLTERLNNAIAKALAANPSVAPPSNAKH